MPRIPSFPATCVCKKSYSNTPNKNSSLLGAMIPSRSISPFTGTLISARNPNLICFVVSFQSAQKMKIHVQRKIKTKRNRRIITPFNPWCRFISRSMVVFLFFAFDHSIQMDDPGCPPWDGFFSGCFCIKQQSIILYRICRSQNNFV